MTARLLAHEPGSNTMTPADVEDCEELLKSGTVFWLDVITTDADELDRLGERFNFDPAAVEDILDIEQLPKFDNYTDHLFVVLHALTAEGERIDTVEVDCFVGENLLVTVSSKPVTGINWLWRSVQKHAQMGSLGADELFAQLAEVIGRRYLEVIAEFESRIDDIADDALDADPDVLGDIQVLRREETTVRKVLRPQRLVLANLRRGTIGVLGSESLGMLGDAYDVHNQVVESLGSARALLSDALDTYRGAAADRQATATTILAVYSAILLPLTLITGWYGMNITLPGDERSYAWELVLAGMAALSLLSFAAFVRAGFIRPPELRRETVLRGLAGAAKAPVKPFTMLRNPRVRRNGGSRSSATKRSQSKTG
ncbi:MAG: magnesium transporter CorA family protein [Acidimicrobiia bacterium]|nr:magnesium transporter CorA family protein [Acidimicrobiia bacterium]